MTNVRPTPPSSVWMATTPAQSEYIDYVHRLQSWCDNIEQLHANQARNIAGYMADVERLTEQVTNLQRLNDNQRDSINEMIEQRTAREATAVNEAIDLEQAIADRNRAQRERDEAVDDIAAIGDALRQEAIERGWCTDYEDFIESVNGELSTPRLPSRKVAYTVRHEYTVTLVGTVYAVDEDHAERVATQQYREIHEDRFFSVPTNDDLVDTGEIVDLEYTRTDTTTTRDED